MKRSLFPVFGLLTLTACGSLETDIDTFPTLATIHANLTNPQSLNLDGPIRAAVIWGRGTGDSYSQVAEDLALTPVFPASFTIDIHTPPPESSMKTPDAADRRFGDPPSVAYDFKVAYGAVVVYVDKNDNGKLDLVAPGASAYIDEIVSTTNDEYIAYVEGTLPKDSGGADDDFPTLGYNLFSVANWWHAPREGSICSIPLGRAWAGISDPIELTIGTNAAINQLMCSSWAPASGSRSFGVTQFELPVQYPDPCDPDLECRADGGMFLYSMCKPVDTGVCNGIVESCTTVPYTRPDPVPADWPCKK